MIEVNQSYRDALRHSIKENKGVFVPVSRYEVDEWSTRIFRSSHRILSATCFLVTSESTFRLAENTMLPYIGLYYSTFHLGTAILSIEYTTLLSQLKDLHHSKLEKLLRSKLVKRSLISEDALDILIELKTIRESINYYMHPTLEMKWDFDFHHNQARKFFDEVVNLIEAIDKEIQDILPLMDSISMNIGEKIGDDTYTSYLSAKDEEEVVKYLVARKLTV